MLVVIMLSSDSPVKGEVVASAEFGVVVSGASVGSDAVGPEMLKTSTPSLPEASLPRFTVPSASVATVAVSAVADQQEVVSRQLPERPRCYCLWRLRQWNDLLWSRNKVN